MLLSDVYINQIFVGNIPHDFHTYYRAWYGVLNRLFTSTEGYTVKPADFRLPSFRDYKNRKGSRKERGWSVEVNNIPLLYCDVNVPEDYNSPIAREAVYHRIEEIVKTIPVDSSYPLHVVVTFGRKFVLFVVDPQFTPRTSKPLSYTITNYALVLPSSQPPKEWEAVDVAFPGSTQLSRLVADINAKKPLWTRSYDCDSDLEDQE